MKLNVISVFCIVTAAALLGMGLGAAFGYFAGKTSPGLFTHFIAWARLDPVPTALIMGMAIGTLLGGMLGVFGIIIQTIREAMAKQKGPSGQDRR